MYHYGSMAFLRVHFRTFIQATESEDKVRKALTFIVADAEKSEIRTEGHFGNSITIMEATISRNRDIKAFLKKLKGTGIIEEMLEKMDDRMDDNCNLHIRLSKDMAYEGQIVLADDRNIIDCSLKTGAYPANKENAMEAADIFLREIMDDAR